MASHLNPIFKPGWKTNCVSKSGCMVWVKANIENPFKSGQPVFKHPAPLDRRVDIPYVGLEPVKGKELSLLNRFISPFWITYNPIFTQHGH